MTRIPAPGDAVLIVKRGTTLHLPAVSRNPATGRPVRLDEYVEAKGSAPPWPTLCGKKGEVWIFGPVFGSRKTCPRCLALAEQAAA